MTQPVIDIKDVSIGFDGKSGETLHVLRNVDMSVSEGESLGIVGESGSGKSTLALAAVCLMVRSRFGVRTCFLAPGLNWRKFVGVSWR